MNATLLLILNNEHDKDYYVDLRALRLINIMVHG